ncbi:acetolactate synthase catalytic subunit [Kaistia dalseonensis]|uniref:Acetolactate synthase-1/2/3 large subunit n=1 Tax=Kaistia dalseonensis TaxID=410840 RepID=A0ABU0H3Y8_9HYPH|nr:acetolactate synthase catalytic subunit [Kaistia dalseonensis]MCX5494440.1 acetolactate synthase catalytic subunit [Kaistia dalseonensis]MDQ0437019.1 acetolactate synthase-1/2/3 large subunit [Kaistia dalseonensis]
MAGETKGKRIDGTVVAMRLAEAFKRHGVDHVFGQSIPSAFHLAAPHVGIRQIVYRTENAGGTMADGYARVTRKVGVVTAQNGPAATLLVPPLAEALKASVPMVALVQDVARSQTDKNAFQEFDHLRLFDSCAKWVRRIEDADRIDDYVDMAFTAATSGRPGPAVLIVPADLLIETVGPAPLSPRRDDHGTAPLDRPTPDATAIATAARLLAEAKAPLVIAGGGVHGSDASAELAWLQETFHLPIATTVMGKGVVSERHPLSLGVIGYFMGEGGRSRDLRPLVEAADVVLLIGNRTNQNGTDSWSLYPRDATFIHLDIDPMEIGRNYEAVRLVGDARQGIAALGEAMARLDLSRRVAARPEIEAKIAAARAGWEALTARIRTEDAVPIRPERVMAVIDAALTADMIITTDASYSSIWAANYLTAAAAGARFITPRGLAGLGWGLPLAIGASLARSGAPVIAIVGDGGFGHVWSELETLKRLDLPVVTIVLNNQILGYQKDSEDVLYGEHTDAVYFAPVDHAAIAQACGIRGVRVEDGAALAGVLAEALASGKPAVIDVLTDPGAQPPVTVYAGQFASPF